VKKKLSIVLGVILALTLLLTSTTYVAAWGYWVEVTLDMTYYTGCGNEDNPCNCCGPCSGVSIGRYYRAEEGYSNLPKEAICDQYGFESNWCYDPMYDELYEHMHTNGCSTNPAQNYGYGYGFVKMTVESGYDNFIYVNDETVTDEDWDAIVNAIDNGWPVAMKGNFKNVPEISGDETGTWPCTKGHYIAIKGYGYWQQLWPPGPPTNRCIICTDSFSKSSDLMLSWDDPNTGVITKGLYLETITIKDEEARIEDFEWGSKGTSLATSGGDVDWAVSTGGSSVAEIYTDYGGRRPHSGTRHHIGFYLQKDGSAYPYIVNGDGNRRLLVRITSAEMIQYYDNAGWHDTGYKIVPYSWYLIELRNINWGAGTYNIYINGNLAKSGAGMHTHSSYNGRIYYGSWAGSGSFYIDDILD